MKKVFNKLLLVISFVLILLLITAGCGNDNDDTALNDTPVNDTSDDTPPVTDTADTATEDADWGFYNRRAEYFVSAMA